jgi:putative Ca2+/H+ antiporter (TMEM165/GDT1 family)
VNGNSIGALIGIAMCLVLVVGGLRSHRLSRQRMLLFAGAWGVIIVVLVLVIQAFGITVE